ncbi:MAG: nucleotidyltransferase domain-containing protein [Candidatus Pacearchaeota archaeon]
MGKIKKILDKVLEEITIEEKELIEVANHIIQQMKNYFKYGEIIVGGSVAKGTTIKSDKYDIDLFFLFNKKEEDLSKKLEKCLNKIKFLEINGEKYKFKFFKVHASRDYFIFQFFYKDKKINLEMIPVLKIDNPNEAKNIMDFSPLHVKYIKNKFNDKLKREVKILKAFTKAANCYGAESYIRGFSGYGLELLILKYRSFINLLKNAVKWKPVVYIDIEKYYKNKNDALKKFNPSKLGPILLVDPIKPDRNVLAALSNENFNKFINFSKSFLSNPSKKFFKKKILDENKLIKKAKIKKAKFLNINIEINAKADVAGAKALKFYKEVEKNLNENYLIFNSFFEFDDINKAKIFFIIKEKKEIIIKGPPLNLYGAVKAFEKAHKIVFIKGKFIYAKEKPKDIKKIIKNIAKNENYKIKNLSIKII